MRIALLALACGLTLTACGGQDGAATSDTAIGADTAAPPMTDVDTGATAAGTVTAMMRDASGRELGTLMLADAATGITVTGQLTGLPPGERAIHVHTIGQCEAPAFTSAGGHWNPTNRQHGTENPQGPHHGDMLNITVGADSTVNVNVTTQGGTLHQADALMDADGAAVVIHAGPDDYRTDPAGNAGDRIACGVVQGGA
ncbi:MAG TPA: superoxide dismutase family protein [Gemmatimonadales bacterium]